MRSIPTESSIINLLQVLCSPAICQFVIAHEVRCIAVLPEYPFDFRLNIHLEVCKGLIGIARTQRVCLLLILLWPTLQS